jgi:hypothetical protein
MTPRRSPRKKAISPEFIVDSDNEEFVGLVSDDQYVVSYDLLSRFLDLSSSMYRLVSDDENSDSNQIQSNKNSNRTKPPKHRVSVRKGKKCAPTPAVESDEDEV